MGNFGKFREDKLSRMLKIERFAGETFAKMAKNREIRESFSPTNIELRKKWMNVISQFRRKGGVDKFSVNKNTVVCEFHFNITEIKVAAGGAGQKRLVHGAVPSIFKFKSNNNKRKRKSPRKRLEIDFNISEGENNSECDDEEHANLQEHLAQLVCVNCEKLTEHINTLQEKLKLTEEELLDSETEKIFLKGECESLRNIVEKSKEKTFRYQNLSADKTFIKSSTGLESERFEALYCPVDPGENCEKLLYYDPIRKKDNDVVTPKPSIDQKRGPKPKLNGIDQLLMLLVWLKNGFSLSHTAWLFDTPQSTV